MKKNIYLFWLLLLFVNWINFAFANTGLLYNSFYKDETWIYLSWSAIWTWIIEDKHIVNFSASKIQEWTFTWNMIVPIGSNIASTKYFQDTIKNTLKCLSKITSDPYSLTQWYHNEEQTPFRSVDIPWWSYKLKQVFKCIKTVWTKQGSEVSYDLKCDIDYYSNWLTSCARVGDWNYSLQDSIERKACTNKPDYSYYTSDWNWANNCSWSCNSWYHVSWSSCVQDASRHYEYVTDYIRHRNRDTWWYNIFCQKALWSNRSLSGWRSWWQNLWWAGKDNWYCWVFDSSNACVASYRRTTTTSTCYHSQLTCAAYY